MKMVFSTTELKDTVKLLEKVNKSKNNPYIRIRSADVGFIIGASDGMVTLEKFVGGELNGEPVDFQVNKNIFTGLVKKVSNPEITLNKTEKGVLFISGKTRIKLPYSDEIIKYVDIDDIDDKLSSELDAKMVLAGLNKVSYAADFNNDDIKFGSVLWHFMNDTIRFVATDRFRLAYSEIENDSEIQDTKFLFPIYPLETFKFLLRETDADSVKIFYQGNKAYLFMDDMILCVLLPGLEPFDYESVIFINNEKCRVKIDRKEFLRSLNLSEVISESRLGERAAHITFDEDIHIVLETENGTLENVTDAEIKGKFILEKTGFYPSNISDALKRADTDNIFITLEDDRNPMFIHEDGDIHWKALVMPVALSGDSE